MRPTLAGVMGAPVEIAYFLLTSAGLCSRCRFPRQVISLRAHTDPAPDHAGAFALTVVVVMRLWWGWHACCRCGVGFCCVSSQLMAADPRRPFLFPSAFDRCRMCCPAHATSGQVSPWQRPRDTAISLTAAPACGGKSPQVTAVGPAASASQRPLDPAGDSRRRGRLIGIAYRRAVLL